MNRITMIIIVAAVAAVSTLAITTSYVTSNASFVGTHQEVKKPQVQILQPDWKAYVTLKDLVDEADVIASGQITSVKKAYDYDEVEIPMTDFNFSVGRVIKGDLHAGDIITIRQTGTETNDWVVMVLSDPLMKQGEQFVVFMRYAPEHGVYAILGGPQGRFDTQNGLVNSLDTLYPEADFVQVKVKNKDLAEFIQDIKSAGVPK